MKIITILYFLTIFCAFAEQHKILELEKDQGYMGNKENSVLLYTKDVTPVPILSAEYYSSVYPKGSTIATFDYILLDKLLNKIELCKEGGLADLTPLDPLYVTETAKYYVYNKDNKKILFQAFVQNHLFVLNGCSYAEFSKILEGLLEIGREGLK
jgi:hypothetical protein